jgi:hypothetical protein
MYTSELQKHGVSEETVNLLNQWVEHRLRSLIKAAWVPTDVHKFLFHNFTNKNGDRCYKIEILEGIDSIRSTAPKKFSRLDEMNYTFRILSDQDQLLILSYIDPLSEVNSQQDWVDYLKSQGIKKNHQNLLIQAMLSLQLLLQAKGIIKVMEEGALRGWVEISEYCKVSIPTMIRMAKDLKMPIAFVGPSVYTTKARLDAFFNQTIDERPYWSEKQKKVKGDSMT